MRLSNRTKKRVAPRSGAWIEIQGSPLQWASEAVAPRSGAWIEILRTNVNLSVPCRSPFGSVD